MATVPDRIASGSAAREDYALRQVPPTWRYRAASIVLSLMGGATAGFFLAFPAELAGSFGLVNVVIGIVYGLVVQTLLNYVFVRAAARTGLNSDLMSRGLALGFDGSAWTTILYWVTWVAYFGTEGQILGGAITAQFGIPTWVSYLIVGAAFIPLVLYGVGFIARFQTWTLVLYVIAMVWMVAKVLSNSGTSSLSSTLGAHWGIITAPGLLGVLAAYNGLIGNVTFGHADIGRMVATRASVVRGSRFGVAAISLIPYSLFAYVIFGGLGLFFWAMTHGSTNPGQYFVSILGVAGFILIIITQLRINLINAYSGSLSLANFFSRLRFIPGRTVWALLMVVVGTGAMFGNILGNLATVLTFEGVFLAAWIGVIFADLVIVRGWFHLGPQGGSWIEYRRAMLPHWNWVGVVPLIVASVVGGLLAFGGAAGFLGGAIAVDISSWVSFLIALAMTTIIGVRAGARSHQTRDLIRWPREDLVLDCPRDHETVSTSDLFPCPFYRQWICASDCMATRGCGEQCRSMTEPELLRVAPLPEPTKRLREANVLLQERQGKSADLG